MRNVILHYHYFKNAGTSVDDMLARNLPGAWVTGEFDGMNNHEAVARWIAANPQASAFSSHTAQFPLPAIEGVRVLPVVFLRHPLDRIASAYAFERKQISESFGARLAKAKDMAGYIRVRLDSPNDMQCRNFQTFRIARLIPGPRVSEMDRALDALTRLPFVGLVEDFDASAARMAAWLRRSFPGFQSFTVHKNETASKRLGLHDRLDRMRSEIGDSLYAELLDANLKDICLHHAATVRVAEFEPLRVETVP